MIRAIRMALYRTMKAWKEAIRKQSKSSQKVPAALCPGAFYCRLPDVLDSDEYIPAGYN